MPTIKDLLNEVEPVVATQLTAYIKLALDSYKKAMAIYKLLKSGDVKPKMSRQKTIAVSEDTVTLSGWDSLETSWLKTVAEKFELSLSQNTNKVTEYYKKHQAEFEMYGYKTKKWNLDPDDSPGKHYHSHAEKQVSVIKPSQSIEVSANKIAILISTH